MKVFAIGSYKGGTGKTTTTVNLAYNVSAKGYRVLVIDADPQANATYMFARVNDNTYTLADLFAGAKIGRCIYRTKYDRLDIVKGSSKMEEAVGEADCLKEALQQVRQKYDELLVPFELDGYGRNGLIILDDYIKQIKDQYNPGLEYHIFISKYAGRASQDRLLSGMIEKYNYPLLSKIVRYRESVNTSIEARKPLSKHRRFDAATRDYQELTNLILQMEK